MTLPVESVETGSSARGSNEGIPTGQMSNLSELSKITRANQEHIEAMLKRVDALEAPAPLVFERGVFYPFPYLETMLAGVMSVQTFLQNLGLEKTGVKRMFQNGLWGDEILKAIEDTTRRDKTLQSPNVEVLAVNSKRKPGRPRKHPAPIRDLH